jgi:hypothetical protein
MALKKRDAVCFVARYSLSVICRSIPKNRMAEYFIFISVLYYRAGAVCFSNLIAVQFRKAACHDNPCFRIFSPCPADKIKGLGICAASDCAGVDNVKISGLAIIELLIPGPKKILSHRLSLVLIHLTP